jgi:hypothetical protein
MMTSTSSLFAFGSLTQLDPPRSFQHFCVECGEQTEHIANLECSNGSIAYCSLCGDECLISFSRTTVGEAA